MTNRIRERESGEYRSFDIDCCNARGKTIACGKICWGATQRQANAGLREHQQTVEHDKDKILG